MQDYLILDNHARINEPSTLGKNWRWRLLPDQLTTQAGLLMKSMTKTYGRMPVPSARLEEKSGKKAERKSDQKSDQKPDQKPDQKSNKTLDEKTDKVQSPVKKSDVKKKQ